MLGKIIGAAAGRRAARTIGTTIGGPAGAAIGYGLASRRFRKLALGGMAVMGGLALIERLREDGRFSKLGETADRLNPFKTEEARADLPETNGDPMPVYAPQA